MVPKIVWTPSILNIVGDVTKAEITVDDPPDWVIIPIGPDERVCKSFEGCSVPLYECIFSMFEIRLSFSDFEMVVIDHLKIFPSQLHLEDWAFMKVFQLRAEYESWKPSLGIFFDLFSITRTLLDDAWDQGLISLHTKYPSLAILPQIRVIF